MSTDTMYFAGTTSGTINGITPQVGFGYSIAMKWILTNNTVVYLAMFGGYNNYN